MNFDSRYIRSKYKREPLWVVYYYICKFALLSEEKKIQLIGHFKELIQQEIVYLYLYSFNFFVRLVLHIFKITKLEENLIKASESDKGYYRWPEFGNKWCLLLIPLRAKKGSWNIDHIFEKHLHFFYSTIPLYSRVLILFKESTDCLYLVFHPTVLFDNCVSL